MERLTLRSVSVNEGRFGRSEVPPLVPADLRDWVPPAQVVNWIEDEVGALAWEHPLIERYLREHPDYQPRLLLSVLVYGCVTAFHSSDALARLCQTESPLARLCGGKRPFASELLGFRRKHRDLIERVIARVYSRAILHRQGNSAGDPQRLEEALCPRRATAWISRGIWTGQMIEFAGPP